jgi:hypothetical protein
MDAMTCLTKHVVAYGQAVWSCPPDAGVKFASEYLAGDGGNKARFTGEITE